MLSNKPHHPPGNEIPANQLDGNYNESMSFNRSLQIRKPVPMSSICNKHFLIAQTIFNFKNIVRKLPSSAIGEHCASCKRWTPEANSFPEHPPVLDGDWSFKALQLQWLYVPISPFLILLHTWKCLSALALHPRLLIGSAALRVRHQCFPLPSGLGTWSHFPKS